MALEIEKVIRKVRPVEAVKVTDDNVTEAAGWCGGLVVPPGHLDNTSDKPYVHVTVRNPRRDSDQQAFPEMWIVKEDFRSFRVLNNKQYRNSYEAQKTAPSPRSMPQRKSDDKSTTTPEPASTGVVSAASVAPSSAPPQPVPLSPTPTEGVTEEKKENNMQGTPEPSEAQTQDSSTQSASTDDVLHGDGTAGGDSMNADALSTDDGAVRDLSQSEEDAEAVQLGQPESTSSDEDAPEEDTGSADEASTSSEDEPAEAPALCGQCGSVTVDGACSQDINHDVNGSAQPQSS